MRFSWYKKLISSRIRDIQINSDFKEASRASLLARIRKTKTWQEPEAGGFWSGFSTLIARQMLKPVLAGFLIFSIASYSSVATVQAAKASLPGDRLYPVKLGIEDVQVGLKFSDEKKAELEVQFAGTRLKEVNEIIEKQAVKSHTESKPKEANNNIRQAIKEFNNGIGSVQKRLEKIGESAKSEEKVLEISKLVNEKTQELEENLLEIKGKIIVAKEEAETEAAVDAVASGSELPVDENSTPEDAVNANTNEDGSLASLEAKEGGSGEMATEDESPQTDEISENSSATEPGASEDPSSAKSEKTDQQEDLLAAVDVALAAVDDINIESLKVFIGKASVSNNQELKKEAVDKLQKKIEKIEKQILKTEERIELIATENRKIIDEEKSGNPSKEDLKEPSSGAANTPNSTEKSSDKKENEASSGLPVNTGAQSASSDKAATSTLQTANESSKEQEKKTSIEKAIKETQDKPKQAKETIAEVKKMLDNEKTGQLDQAIQKVMQAKAIVKDANNDIKNVVQEITKKNKSQENENQVSPEQETGKPTENTPASSVPGTGTDKQTEPISIDNNKEEKS